MKRILGDFALLCLGICLTPIAWAAWFVMRLRGWKSYPEQLLPTMPPPHCSRGYDFEIQTTEIDWDRVLEEIQSDMGDNA